MTQIEQLEMAVKALPKREFAEFKRWLLEYDDAANAASEHKSNAERKKLLRKKKLGDFLMKSPLAGSELDVSRMKGDFRKAVEL